MPVQKRRPIKKRKNKEIINLTPDQFNANRRNKNIVLGAICMLIIVFFVGRVGYIKIVKGGTYEKLAIANQVSRGLDKTIKANRGSILDRNKEVLASSSTVYTIILDVDLIFKTDAGQKNSSNKGNIINKTVEDIMEVLDMKEEDIRKYFQINADGSQEYKGAYFKIAQNVSTSTATKFKEKKTVGVFLEEDSHRNYLYNNFASNVLGYIRGDSSSGLENKYNAEMEGIDGRVFRVVDEDKNVVEQRIEPVPGNNITTTLDFNIQKYAEDAVVQAANEYKARKAGVIVMNPNTGEIFAMAQYPSFNSNDPISVDDLTSPQLKEEWSLLDKDQQVENMMGVWRNFNISDTFEPGSTFKPITVAAAFEESVINDTDTFFCGGSEHIIDTDIYCWNLDGHGTQTARQALSNSCNIAMSEIAKKMGKKIYYKYQTDFGFGEKTGIDLPGESAVDNKSLRYSLAQLNPVELATSSFGQGFNATPMQSINAFAATINGGNLMKPFIVSQVVDVNGNVIKQNEPTIMKKVISSTTSDYMRTAMQDVVDSGTGVKARIEGYNIGGKTGTAQQGARKDNKYMTSMIAYFPVENPQYIALISVDLPEVDANGDAHSPGPIIKSLFLNIIKYKNIPPSNDESEVDINREDNSFMLDDYKGTSIAKVTKSLNDSGIDYEIVGNGEVVERQLPAGGSYVSQGAVVNLYLKSIEDETNLTEVPDVTGLTEAQAYDLLEKQELLPRSFVRRTLVSDTNTEEDIDTPIDTPIDISIDETLADNETNEANETESPTASPSASNSIEDNMNVEIPLNVSILSDSGKISDTMIISGQRPKAGVKVEKGTEIKIIGEE